MLDPGGRDRRGRPKLVGGRLRSGELGTQRPRAAMSGSAAADTRRPTTAEPDRELMRKDVREFIRRLEAAGLTVESTPAHYRVLRGGKPLRKANGMPFMLPFSPDTIRWRRAAILELRKLGVDL
jgi:hypothetical protein